MRRPLPTLLHRAALGWREGELRVARLLIDHGADVNSTEGGALAPLEMAAWSRHPGMAELLIAAGADVELTSRCRRWRSPSSIREEMSSSS